MSTLNELAAASHADATRRGIYPQRFRASLDDIEGELSEVREQWEALRQASVAVEEATTNDELERAAGAVLAAIHGLREEVADVLLCTLSTMHDMGMDIDAEVARKMAVNRTRGPRA